MDLFIDSHNSAVTSDNLSTVTISDRYTSNMKDNVPLNNNISPLKQREWLILYPLEFSHYAVTMSTVKP